MFPSVNSAEYKLNPGLALVKPEAAWAAGAAGQGITVAVIDSGVVIGTHDLDGRLTNAPTDVVTARNQPTQSRDVHATMVAGFVAANFDGRGTVGVAFQSNILSIRADELGPCGTDAGAPAGSDCGFLGTDLGAALDYATTHGARVINMSLGGDSPSSTTVRNAMLRATNAGLVVVAAAGNADAGTPAPANPGYPGRLAVDTQYNGQIIAVGALNAAGTDIADYSYRAGVAQNFYLLAPGTDVWSGCGLPSPSTPGQIVCYSGSGTSFATPVVSGAAALLMSGFPNLNAHDVVDILLRSARDMGPTGIDPVYGRGALDISRAFQPIGTFSVPGPGGLTAIAEDTGPKFVGPLALGDALSRGEGLSTVGYDEYHRMFNINLGGYFRQQGRASLGLTNARPVTRAGVSVTTPDGAQLNIASLQSRADMAPLAASGLDLTNRTMDVAASYAKGGLRFDLWTGRNGAQPAFDAAEADAFSALAGAGRAVRAGYALGDWTLSAEEGAGQHGMARQLDFAGGGTPQDEATSRYTRLLANFHKNHLSATVGLGQLDEAGGPLGSFATPGSDFSTPAVSRFVSLRAAFSPTPGLGLSAEGAVGRTDAQGRALSLSNAISSSWRLQAVANCGLFRLACDGLSLEISQPVRVESGRLSAYLADQPTGYFDPLSYSTRSMALSPSGRELDLRLSSWKDLSLGALRLEASALVDEGHRADAPLNLGVSAAWSLRF